MNNLLFQESYASDNFSYFLKGVGERDVHHFKRPFEIPKFQKFVREKLEEFASVSKKFGLYNETLEFYHTFYDVSFKSIEIVIHRLTYIFVDVTNGDKNDLEFRKTFLRIKDISDMLGGMMTNNRHNVKLALLYPFFFGIQVMVSAMPLGTNEIFLPVDELIKRKQ